MILPPDLRASALMLAPTLAAVGVEWVVLNRCFTAELGRSPGRQAVSAAPHLPRLALAVLAATLAGFLAGSLFGVSPVWIAAAVTVASGPAALLAALIGVNVGPNLTYAGSLASLLWRRLLRAQDTDVNLGQFLRLGQAVGHLVLLRKRPLRHVVRLFPELEPACDMCRVAVRRHLRHLP